MIVERETERDHGESSKGEARANGDSVIHSTNPSTGLSLGTISKKSKFEG